MRAWHSGVLALLFIPAMTMIAVAALTVPTEIQQPGSQPGQIGNLESADKCDNCHGGYDPKVEPAYVWRGSMMAHAGRDPIFWATVAIAEQSFDGAGDLCLRCHAPAGWLAGRSTPTDGSALTAADADGVECDSCHKTVNPDNSEYLGVQLPPFLANNEGNPPIGYYGGGQFVLWNGSEKLGPYSNAEARHQFLQSKFHRSVDFCGTCHDVSNPAVGDLAHNHGAQVPLAPGTFSGTLGAPVQTKAAFNNFPYQYGVVERTYSEYKAGLLSQTRVSSFASLPADLKAGSVKAAYESALLAGRGGDHEDGTPRFFSCQTCHMSPAVGQGCNKNPPVRKDLPLHDLTGGNYWMPEAIQYLDGLGQLRLGGGLLPAQVSAMNDGKLRAQTNLTRAAALTVNGNTLKVTNLTGHKLISGYPEGRRMWLNIKWYSSNGIVIREDGRYGDMTANINGQSTTVKTILNLNDPNTRIYEAHGAMTQQWATQLLALGYSSNMPLSYDRLSGAVTKTLGQLAAQASSTYHETFHFALNNSVVKDNRIPPYGMSFDEATKRNILPVPASQYGAPSAGGTFRYWDEVALNPPAGAVNANIDLLYQPTSWEYIQFLYRANNRSVVFLANEGDNILQAWLNTGMAQPYVMASASWTASATTPTVSGFWPGAVVDNSFVFVFGSNFIFNQTQVAVGGVPATVMQMIDASLLFFMPPSPSASGFITVTTPSGTATSSTPFGVPLTGLAVTGLWPAQGSTGSIVFVFGHNFVSMQTQVSLNGVGAPIVQVIDGGLLFFMVPAGAATGPITVTTPTASVITSSNFTVIP